MTEEVKTVLEALARAVLVSVERVKVENIIKNAYWI